MEYDMMYYRWLTFLIVLTTCPRVLVPISFLDFEKARHTRECRFSHYFIRGTHNIDVSPFGGERTKGVLVLPRLASNSCAQRTSSSAPE